MKYTLRLAFCAPICIAASFVTASSASAATVLLSSGVEALSTGSTTQLKGDGTKIFAWDVNVTPTAPVVNGITFSGTQPTGAGVEGAVTLGGWAATGSSTAANYSAAGAGMQDLLVDYLFSAQGSPVATLSLANLVNGQEYRIQFLHYQEGTNMAARDMKVFFGTTSGTGTTSFGASNGGQPVGVGGAFISTFDFIADSAGTQLFSFQGQGDDRVLLNSVTLFAVPEPSAALLGGLGMLALLRRRRA